MGLQVDRDEFEEAEYAEFAAKLGEAVGALDELLARPGFGQGPATLGAELEVNLVDAAGAPATVNRAVLADAIDPRFALEIDRFNLEFNASPVPLVGRPFAALGDELRGALEDLERAAVGHGARLAVIGILPTVELSDLQRSALSELPRYRALNRGLRRLRQAPFQVRIQGEERLEVECDDVTLEGPTPRSSSTCGSIPRPTPGPTTPLRSPRRPPWPRRATLPSSSGAPSGTRRGSRCSSRAPTTGPSRTWTDGRPRA